MRYLRRTLRRAIAFILYYTGVLWIYAAIRLRKQAVVLMYHRVLPEDAETFSHSGIRVSPDTFDRHMAFIARRFRALTPLQFKQQLANSSFDARACLVTFDDGWWDNIEYALPILKKHNVPAIVFVATSFIGSSETFWQETLARLMHLAAAQGETGRELLCEIGFDFDLSTPTDRLRVRIREFITSLKTRDASVARGMIERLQSGVTDGSGTLGPSIDRFMTWDEVKALQGGGLVTIGSHAHSHARLSTLGYKGARQELEVSRLELTRNGVSNVFACAYPNGDVTDPVEAAATDAGFTLGFATKRGSVRHSSESMHLRRINIHDADCRSRTDLLYRMLGLP